MGCSLMWICNNKVTLHNIKYYSMYDDSQDINEELLQNIFTNDNYAVLILYKSCIFTKAML